MHPHFLENNLNINGYIQCWIVHFPYAGFANFIVNLFVNGSSWESVVAFLKNIVAIFVTLPKRVVADKTKKKKKKDWQRVNKI